MGGCWAAAHLLALDLLVLGHERGGALVLVEPAPGAAVGARRERHRRVVRPAVLAARARVLEGAARLQLAAALGAAEARLWMLGRRESVWGRESVE